MNFHVITLFPEVVTTAARGFGVVGQAITRGDIGFTAFSPRDFTSNVHHTVDDRPFGGGDGMIMMAGPLAQSVARVRESIASRRAHAASTLDDSAERGVRVIHVSPRGEPLTDRKARELANYDDLILISSRYGGADQRFLNACVDEEISIGDYILTGGELAALVIIDAVGRLKPGVLGNEASSSNESFAGQDGLLEHPQYTRPREWEGRGVPAVYLSGDHKKIAEFQAAVSVFVTAFRRPDLLPADLPVAKLQKRLAELSDADLTELGLAGARELILKALAQI